MMRELRLDEQGDFPLDRRVDRRAFLKRMTAITAAATAGAAAAPLTPRLGAATREVGKAPAAAGAAISPSPFSGPLPLPDAASVLVDDPADLTLAEASALIESGRLIPIDLVEAYLERIARHDGTYLAFNLVMAEQARSDAIRLERAPWRGPLHGIPLALKDNLYTAGVRTTANSHIFADFVPEFDATVVRRLAGAGAFPLGKTQMGPLATTRATTPDGEWTTRNAWAPNDPGIAPGGSSSGSATAVAARLAASSLGTQTGGSINNPALAQGLTGLKPTMGLVSLYGVIPLTYTRDHVGPLARDALDAAVLLQALAGPDPADPRTVGHPRPSDYVTAATPVRRNGRAALRWPTTVGVPPGYLEPPVVDEPQEQEQEQEQPQEAEARARRLGRERADVEARRRMLQTFEELGARVVEVELPRDWDVLSGRLFNNVRLPERSEPFLDYLRDDVRQFGVSLGSWINGLLLDGTEYLKGQRAKLLLLERILNDLFGQCDVVVQTDAYRFDIVGLPLINFPIGFEEASTGHPRPLGALFGAMPYAEDRLLALAAAYQSITDWHRRRPADPDSFPAVRSGRASPGRVDLREVVEFGQ